MPTRQEADWKKFKKMVPELRERYLTGVNKEMAALLADESKTSTERFWEIEKKSRQEAKILQRCFDGHSRSRLSLFMMNMFHCGIMREDDFAGFSEDIQDLLFRMQKGFNKE